MDGEGLYGPRTHQPVTEVSVLQEILLEGKQAWVCVSFIKGAEEISPQTSLGDLVSEGRVDLSAVFSTDYQVKWPEGDVTLRVRPWSGHECGDPHWWVGDIQSSNKGVRDLLESLWWFEFDEFWDWLDEEKHEEASFLEQMFEDTEALQVRYTVFKDLSGIGDRLEALAGGYLWTLAENPENGSGNYWWTFPLPTTSSSR